MGVQGLWELLAPVGRRVSVETLAGKKVAIDASIWMVQFMKAMRDEKGEMVRNAHILGFFRRICKLLFLRTRPVFVFDGGTPALKRRTVAARRRHRENAHAKIRKTAEKLLLNHLKRKGIEDLAAEIKQSNQTDKSNGKQEDVKGKQIRDDGNSGVPGSSGEHSIKEDVDVSEQERLDELLVASLVAEEGQGYTRNEVASTSQMRDDDEDDENEEMIYPVMEGNIDPSVLASLPPSMQLDLLVQMRERLMAENRQKYQKIKKMPAKFSELQIQSYLKTVSFRREIDQVQKYATGRGVEGVQTSRIASEANKEFIFSSSFTGDRLELASNGVGLERNAGNQGLQNDNSTHSRNPKHSNSVSQASASEVPQGFEHVETYVDERGRVRVSRVRGLGIRMTRDLQHNLDLMKEYELKKCSDKPCTDLVPDTRETNVDLSARTFTSTEENHNSTYENTGTLGQVLKSHQFDEPSVVAPIEISFLEEDGDQKDAADEDLFLHLVSGSSTLETATIFATPNKDASDSEADSIWEEGAVEDNNRGRSNDVNTNIDSSLAANAIHEDHLVDWEDGISHDPLRFSDNKCKHGKAPSIGLLEEEADIQEALRRSLVDFQRLGTLPVSCGDANRIESNEKFVVNLSKEGSALSMNMSFEPNEDTSSMPCSRAFSPVSEIQLHGEPSVAANESNQILGSPFQDQRTELVTGEVPQVVSLTCSEKTVRLDQGNTDSSSTGRDEPGLKIPLEDIPVGENVGLEGTGAFQHNAADNVSKFGSHDVISEVSESRENFNPCSEKIHIASEVDHEQMHGTLDSGISTVGHDSFGDVNFAEGSIDAEMSEAYLDKELYLLQQERMKLGDEQRKLERNAETVSSEMFAECQELLQMFGLPYIIAPMEAEAQCAYMEMKNLVDGVVTDDSDVFLFGARSVYKNIFDDRKYVETYFMKDIESELGLTRDKLVRMAMLLGSDYTEGVSGIGIVNAIETVHAFPEEDGLNKFREWLESPDPSILGLDDKPAADDISEAKRTFMKKHRNVSKNWHIPSSFPSESVVSAYTSPQVDESTESFSWGKPDLPLLRRLCWDKFGWNNQKADELLVPVLKEYSKHETQLRLEAFYTFNERFAKIRSQRIKKAVRGITGSSSSELMVDPVPEGSMSRRKRRPSAVPDDQKLEINTDKNENSSFKSSTPSRRTEKIHGQRKNNLQGQGRGRGRQKVRSKETGRGRGRRKEEADFDSTESDVATSGEHSDADKIEKHGVTSKDRQELRRSTRQHNQVKYSEEHVDDAHGRPSDPGDTSGSGKIAAEPGITESEAEDVIQETYYPEAEVIESPDRGPKEYLFSGGGFCIEEDNEHDEVGADGGEPPESSMVDAVGVSESKNDIDESNGLGAQLRVDEDRNLPTVTKSPVVEEEKHDENPGLRPMSSLKRRKKNNG